jgi:hypothetical protein
MRKIKKRIIWGNWVISLMHGVDLMYEKVKELVDFAFHSGVTNVLVVFPGFDLLYFTEDFGLIDMFETDLNKVVKINVLILDKIKANK